MEGGPLIFAARSRYVPVGFLKRNILFVDDDESTRTLVGAMLKQGGYFPLFANDSFDGLDRVHKQAVDLVLLDIMMPKMNGVEFLRRLKSSDETKDIPVIMFTSKNDKASIQKAVQAGASGYLVKPPDREKLLSKIEQLLGGRPRFAEVDLSRESEWSECRVLLNSQILSIGESGLIMKSPLSLPEKSSYVIESPIFEKIGIPTPNLEVIQSQPQEDGSIWVFFSYNGVCDSDLQKIRSWAVGALLKRGGKVA